MNKQIIIWAAFLCLTAQIVVGQRNYHRADFEQINATYEALTFIKTEVEYVLFSNHTTESPYHKQAASLWRKGDRFLYQIDGVSTLTTPERTYLIDENDRQIIVQHTPAQKRDPLTGIDLDHLLQYCLRISYVENTPSLRTYTMELPEAEIEKVDISFNTQSYLMQKVILYYRVPQSMEEGMKPEKPRLEIHYVSQDTQPNFSSGTFNEAQYVVSKAGKLQPAKRFENFELIDHTKLR